MTPTESAELGPVLHRLVPAVKAATGVERAYCLALMERAAHFHLWLVPKKDEGELRGVAYLAQQPPLTASLSAAEEMSQKIRGEFGGLEGGHGSRGRRPRHPAHRMGIRRRSRRRSGSSVDVRPCSHRLEASVVRREVFANHRSRRGRSEPG
jgi:hypothetical protein